MYLFNILGETRSEPVEDRWFRQAQPTWPRFFEKERLYKEKTGSLGKTRFSYLFSGMNRKIEILSDPACGN